MGTAKRGRGERLYRRGDTWWCRVRNAAGRTIRKSTRCRDYQAAVVVAAEFERAAASTTHATAEETAFQGCVNDYLADLVRRGRSKATIEIAQQKTGHMLRLWGKSFPMGRISARVVTEYIDKRLSESASRFTVKKELGHLGQVLRIARHHGVFHLDPERVVPPYFSGEHRPRTRWLTPDELRKLLDELDRRRAAHVAYIVATGSRWSESLRARRGDIDVARGLARIRGTKTDRADAEVPISAVNEGLLEEALADAPGRDLLFHPWGKVVRDLKAACVRAGIEPCSPNDLRRTFGHWHRQAGIPVDIVALMLRHATDKLAQTTYARLAGEALRALVTKQLQSTSGSVPVLYQEGASDDPKALPVHEGNALNTSAPGKNRTCDLRFRNPKDTRRSRGTILGVARSRVGSGVSELYAGVPSYTPGRTFRLVGHEMRQVSP